MKPFAPYPGDLKGMQQGVDEVFSTLARRLKKEGKKENKSWKIIKYHPDHRIISSRKKSIVNYGMMIVSDCSIPFTNSYCNDPLFRLND